MVIVLIVCVVIILAGVVYGLVRRPKTQARRQAYSDGLKALAARTGWQIARPDATGLRTRFRNLSDVLGTTIGTDELVQLTGQWRGTPIQAFQLGYWKDRVAVRTQYHATLITVQRPMPGPAVTLTAPGLTWANVFSGNRKIGYQPFDDRYHVHAGSVEEAQAVLTPPLAMQLATDPRMQDRILFFTDQEVAAVFPGDVTQEAVTMATADLLLDVTARMAVR